MLETHEESLTYDVDLRVEFSRDLNRALNTLKPIDRSIVYLYVVEEMTMAEIGLALGLTENAVKIRAHRSYAKMKDTFITAIIGFLLFGSFYEGF